MYMAKVSTPAKVTAKTTSSVKIAPAKAANVAAAPKKDATDFTTGDYVVYPTHGVGTVDGIETATVGGMQVTMYKIAFKHDRMILRVPVQTARAKGLRKLASGDRLAEAMNTLKGRAKVKRTMWSRRAQEYESKINSGDPVAIAEVLRDLKRSNDDVEQSFSERQIYQSALSRLAREVAAVEKLTEADAACKLEGLMGKIKKAAANDTAAAA
jgi:CarD family transcriptional regulator